MSDIDTAVVDSLKALDPKRPIREAEHLGGKRAALRLLQPVRPYVNVSPPRAALGAYHALGEIPNQHVVGVVINAHDGRVQTGRLETLNGEPGHTERTHVR